MNEQNSEATKNTVYENTIETQTEQKKNRTPWMIAGVLLVVLLAGAAFVGGTLLERQSAPVPDEMAMGFTPAEEVPETEPELVGTVSQIDGDTLRVTEFSINDMMVYTDPVAEEGGALVEENEIPAEEMEYLPQFFGADGPVAEVVITHETKIFRDTTFQNFGYTTEDVTIPERIEQTMEPGKADEIGTGALVTIWGERRGDRIIASFVLYEPAIEIQYGDG